MEKFLKKEILTSMISSIVLLIIGVVLFLKPIGFINVVTYIIEATLIVIGIVTIINYLRVDVKYDVFSLGFVKGIVCIIAAIFLIVNPTIIITIMPIMIGIWMVFGSLTKLQIIIKLSSFGERTNILHIIVVVIMFTIGIVCIFNPFKTGEIIMQALGIALFSYSIIDLIEEVSAIKFLNKMNK